MSQMLVQGFVREYSRYVEMIVDIYNLIVELKKVAKEPLEVGKNYGLLL